MFLMSATAADSFWRTPPAPAIRAPFNALRLIPGGLLLSVTASPNSLTQVGVFIDGVFNQAVTWSGTVGVLETKLITLPAGSAGKLVELVSAGTSASLAAHCVDITEVSGDFFYLSPPTSSDVQLVVWGDSIGVGTGATPDFNGWNVLLPYSLSSNWGVYNSSGFGQQLVSMVLDASRVAATLATLTPMFVGRTQNLFNLDLCTNDWAAGRTPTQVTANLTTLRGAIVGAFPSVKFIWSSPVGRLNQMVPNVSGFTLVDICNAIQAFAIANGDTFNDGQTAIPPAAPGVIPPGIGADGLHPTNLGHGWKLAQILPVLATFSP